MATRAATPPSITSPSSTPRSPSAWLDARHRAHARVGAPDPLRQRHRAGPLPVQGGRDQPDLAGLRATTPTRGRPDRKPFVTPLSAALARLRPELVSHAVDPGWVPTKMGGPDAPDDLQLGHETQEWLATSDDTEALT